MVSVNRTSVVESIFSKMFSGLLRNLVEFCKPTFSCFKFSTRILNIDLEIKLLAFFIYEIGGLGDFIQTRCLASGQLT